MKLEFNVVTEVRVNNLPNLNDVEEHLKRLIERLSFANNLSGITYLRTSARAVRTHSVYTVAFFSMQRLIHNELIMPLLQGEAIGGNTLQITANRMQIFDVEIDQSPMAIEAAPTPIRAPAIAPPPSQRRVVVQAHVIEPPRQVMVRTPPVTKPQQHQQRQVEPRPQSHQQQQQLEPQQVEPQVEPQHQVVEVEVHASNESASSTASSSDEEHHHHHKKRCHHHHHSERPATQ